MTRQRPKPISGRRLQQIRHEVGIFDYILSSDVERLLARYDRLRRKLRAVRSTASEPMASGGALSAADRTES